MRRVSHIAWCNASLFFGIPCGNRTRVAAVKGRCPRPLDERDEGGQASFWSRYSGYPNAVSMALRTPCTRVAHASLAVTQMRHGCPSRPCSARQSPAWKSSGNNSRAADSARFHVIIRSGVHGALMRHAPENHGTCARFRRCSRHVPTRTGHRRSRCGRRAGKERRRGTWKPAGQAWTGHRGRSAA